MFTMSMRWGDHGHEDRDLHVDKPGHAGQVKLKTVHKQADIHVSQTTEVSSHWTHPDNTKTIERSRDIKTRRESGIHTTLQTSHTTLLVELAESPNMHTVTAQIKSGHERIVRKTLCKRADVTHTHTEGVLLKHAGIKTITYLLQRSV